MDNAKSKSARKTRSPTRRLVHRLYLAPRGGGNTIIVTLTPPSKSAEICPITCEEIGSPDSVVPYAPSKLTPFKAYPTLSRASLTCGHKFHAPAILVHFMRNGLTCPMCRAGASGLPTKASLPIRQEEWFRQTYEAISRENEADERAAVEDDHAMAHAMILEQTNMLLQTLSSDDFVRQLRLDDIMVTATVYFFRDDHPTLPPLGMPMDMHLMVMPRAEVRHSDSRLSCS